MLEKQGDRARVEAVAPGEGIFCHPQQGLAPEYFIELIAQAMAAASGFDRIEQGLPFSGGFLVGIDEFTWHGTAAAGEILHVDLEKRFEFDAVTVMEGRVMGRAGCIARGSVKVWETDKG